MNPTTSWHAESFFDIVRARRTVRSFRPDPVPDEDLDRILDAARMAPSSGNQQPWRFLVIRDGEKLRRLRDEATILALEQVRERLRDLPLDEVKAHRARIRSYLKGLMSAPVYVFILVDRRSAYPAYNVQDGALAAAHLMLAARALGYGTAYTTDALPEPAIRRIMGISEQYDILCVLPVGVPEQWPEPPPKKDLRELVMHETLGGEG